MYWLANADGNIATITDAEEDTTSFYDFARSYRDLPSVADDIRRHAQAVLAGRNAAPYRTMGLLTDDDAAEIGALLAVNVSGYDYAIDRFAPLHIFREHGDQQSEAARGQRAIIPTDYARLPQILNEADNITRDGNEIIIEKSLGEERQILAFERLNKRKMMNLISMRIIAKRPRAQRP